MRAVRHALIIVGLISLPYIIVINQAHSMFGFDAHAYWAVDLSNLYGNAGGNTSDLDAFRYTPAAGQAFSVFGVLPWEVFFAGYFAAMIGALVWLTGRTWLVLLAFPPIPLELYHGNIHLFMAVAIVVGFRYPMAWAFIVLTKVSPGVGALWFAFRREWRLFGIAVFSTLLIAGISYVIAPDLWRQYVSTMVEQPRLRPRPSLPGADPAADPDGAVGRDRLVGRPDGPPLDGAGRGHDQPPDHLVPRARPARGRDPALARGPDPARAAQAVAGGGSGGETGAARDASLRADVAQAASGRNSIGA